MSRVAGGGGVNPILTMSPNPSLSKNTTPKYCQRLHGIVCTRRACHKLSRVCHDQPARVHAPFTPAVGSPMLLCQQPSPSPTWASSGSRDLHIVTSSPKLKQHCESALPHKEELTTRVEYVEQAAEAEQHSGRIRHNHKIPGYHTRSTKLWQPHHHPQCLHVFHHSIILWFFLSRRQ